MNKLKKIVVNYTIPKNLNRFDGLEYWRDRIARIIVLSLVIFGLIALIPGVVLAVQEKLWSVAIIDTLVYLIVLVIFACKNISYKIKASILITTTFLLGIFLQVVIGPLSAGYIWMFIAPTFAAVFFGRRIAWISIFLNLIALILLGTFHYYDFLLTWHESQLTIGVWTVIITSFMLLNIGVVFSINQISNGLENTLKKEKSINEILKLQKDMLIKSREEAIRANEVKSEFLAQMSHEIRTPMNTVLSYISLLKQNVKSDDPIVHDCFDVIENGSSRLIRTIDMILNMAEFQTGSYTAKYSEVSIVEDILLPLKTEFEELAKNKSLRFQLQNDLISATKVKVDQYSITQLFANLIDNAIKYTEDGTVSLQSYSDNGNIIVKVKDTGIGIAEEFKDKLFEPFAQEESGYTRTFDGNRLGLALVKKYCEINKAEISLESIKGSGSTFTVKLSG